MTKTKLQKVASMPKKVHLSKAKGICKPPTPQVPTHMKAPPKSSVSHPAPCLALRQSVCIPKPKKHDQLVGWLLFVVCCLLFAVSLDVGIEAVICATVTPFLDFTFGPFFCTEGTDFLVS
jgi:hypothetical protein